MVDDVVWFSFNVGVLFDAKNEEVVFFELLINVLVVEIDCFIGKEQDEYWLVAKVLVNDDTWICALLTGDLKVVGVLFEDDIG